MLQVPSRSRPPGYGEKGQLEILREITPWLWPAGRPDLRWRVVAAFAALLLSKIVTVTTPFAFKYAIDGLNAAVKPEAQTAVLLAAVPLAFILAYGMGRIMMVVLAQVRDALFAKVAQSAVRALSIRTFRHLHALSLKFHLERRTGGLSRTIERGSNGIDTVLRYSLFNTIPTIIELVLLCGVLTWTFGWIYAAITAATVALYTAFSYIATEWRIRIRRTMNEADTEANTKAVDSLLNYETVKYFNNEEHEARRFDQSMARYEKAAVRTWESLAVLNSGQTVVFTAGLALMMILAARGVAGGTMTVGDFVMVNSFLIQLYMPLNFLGNVYRDLKQGLIDIEAMFRLLEMEPDIKDRPGAVPLVVSSGEVAFEDVRFAYEPVRPILKGVSFTVPAGRTFAVVGPSGAGKSTISRLLYRFYELDGGRILIDGQDIAGVTQGSLRAEIGMVPQDTVLFNDTIRYNIRYGRPDATDEEVEAAARLAQVHGFVLSLPSGYDTLVGERGLKLSGGEKQRVSIARTILKGPPILVLDEATSALDSMTEQEIQSALRQVSRGRTSLVIAHRLSTVIDADEILVLDEGRIVERGRHLDLLLRNGVYAGMWNRQRAADEARRALVENLDEGELAAEGLAEAEREAV